MRLSLARPLGKISLETLEAREREMIGEVYRKVVIRFRARLIDADYWESTTPTTRRTARCCEITYTYGARGALSISVSGSFENIYYTRSIDLFVNENVGRYSGRDGVLFKTG